MAFFGDSERKPDFLGLGKVESSFRDYNTEETSNHHDGSHMHRAAPFASPSMKKMMSSVASKKHLSPGPGHYEHVSSFDSARYVPSMDDRGTYLTKRNGSLVQRKQIFNMNNLEYGKRGLHRDVSGDLSARVGMVAPTPILPGLHAAVSLKHLVSTPQEGNAYLTPGGFGQQRTPALLGLQSEPVGANQLSHIPSVKPGDFDTVEYGGVGSGVFAERSNSRNAIGLGLAAASPTEQTRIAATATIDGSMTAVSDRRAELAPRQKQGNSVLIMKNRMRD